MRGENGANFLSERHDSYHRKHVIVKSCYQHVQIWPSTYTDSDRTVTVMCILQIWPSTYSDRTHCHTYCAVMSWLRICITSTPAYRWGVLLITHIYCFHSSILMEGSCWLRICITSTPAYWWGGHAACELRITSTPNKQMIHSIFQGEYVLRNVTAHLTVHMTT